MDQVFNQKNYNTKIMEYYTISNDTKGEYREKGSIFYGVGFSINNFKMGLKTGIVLIA